MSSVDICIDFATGSMGAFDATAGLVEASLLLS